MRRACEAGQRRTGRSEYIRTYLHAYVRTFWEEFNTLEKITAAYNVYVVRPHVCMII